MTPELGSLFWRTREIITKNWVRFANFFIGVFASPSIPQGKIRGNPDVLWQA